MVAVSQSLGRCDVSDQQMRKQFAAAVKSVGARQRRFVISTPDPDRDNDVVMITGWRLENYRRNPVVLWAHDYHALPIGRAIDVRIEGRALVATVEFAEHQQAVEVMRLVDGGFLRATSVGFRPLRFELNERGGVDYYEQELLEFSIVPVPANPEALIAAGIDRGPLKGWMARWPCDGAVLDIIDDSEVEVDRSVALAAFSELPHLVREGLRAAIYEETGRAIARAKGRIWDGDPVGDPATRHHRSGEVLDVDPHLVASMTRQVVREALDRQRLRTVVREATAVALARARGRVD